MRLFLLTALTMLAFASNSILNRLAIDSGAAGPGGFAVVRVLAGAAMLTALIAWTGRQLPLASANRVVGAGALSLYMVGFSLAYLTLDAGLGALILFGVVQITMFGLSALAGAGGTRRQVSGAAIAFAGLVYILWPGADAQADTAGAALMILAGIGWAGYTLVGRREPDALAATGANFVLALPVTALAIWLVGSGWHVTPIGYLWAILSGAVTSGLGYALWYRVLPGLSAPVAATVQLSVPVIAIAAGVLLLGESAGWQLILGTLLVVGGIALAVTRRP